MSLPLIDLRAKITAEADAVLHKWAVAEIHAASVLQMILAQPKNAITIGKQADSDKRARLRRANI